MYATATETIYDKRSKKILCLANERLMIITKNAGSWCIVVAATGLLKHSPFSVRWEKLKDITNVNEDFELE